MLVALSPPSTRFLNRASLVAAATSLSLGLAIAACTPASSSRAADAGVTASTPPKISVSRDREDLVFTFQVPDTGAFETATSPDEVPESARRSVVVTDLSLSPAQRQAGRYVYVTDLTAMRKDGTFPVAVASRYGFEAQLTGTATAAKSGREVVVYSASWCGVCKTTKRLLENWNVPFVDKDIEASRSAQQELANKAARAGIRPGGVPVIDVAGLLLQGLDEDQLRAALQRTGFL